VKISKEEWVQWKDSIVTRGFFQAMNERIEDCKDILAVSAGLNPDEDNFYRGFIRAYSEALDFKIDDMEGEND